MILKISTETHDSPRKSKKFAYLSCRSDHHDQPWTWSRTHGAGLKRIGANFLQKSEAWFWDGISSLRNVLEIYWNILETTFSEGNHIPTLWTCSSCFRNWKRVNSLRSAMNSTKSRADLSDLFCFCHFTLIQASASWIIYICIYSYMHMYIYIHTLLCVYLYIDICNYIHMCNIKPSPQLIQ